MYLYTTESKVYYNNIYLNKDKDICIFLNYPSLFSQKRPRPYIGHFLTNSRGRYLEALLINYYNLSYLVLWKLFLFCPYSILSVFSYLSIGNLLVFVNCHVRLYPWIFTVMLPQPAACPFFVVCIACFVVSIFLCSFFRMFFPSFPYLVLILNILPFLYFIFIELCYFSFQLFKNVK